jgi:predicted nucleic acid-binding protein
MDFMLDTCVINRILDGRNDNGWSLRGRNFVTDIQLQEILDTSNDARRDYLFRGLLAMQLNVIRPTEMPQLFDCDQNFDTGERFMLGMASVWYRSGFPLSFGNFVPAIAADLPRNDRRPENPLRDGFIAEAALLNGMTLVTADHRLATTARAFGAQAEEIP